MHHEEPRPGPVTIVASTTRNRDSARTLRPADLARAGGVSPQTVRRYERLGVLPAAARSPGGYRRYDRAHLMAMHAARAVIRGYGRPVGVQVMTLVHAGRFDEAFAVADARHARLHAQRVHATATLASIRGLAGTLPVAGWSQPIQIGPLHAEIAAGLEMAPRWGHATRVGLGSRLGAPMLGADHPRHAPAVAFLRSAPPARCADEPFPAPAAGAPDDALSAAAARLAAVDEASGRCAAATAVLWRYVRTLQRGAASPGRARGGAGGTLGG